VPLYRYVSQRMTRASVVRCALARRRPWKSEADAERRHDDVVGCRAGDLLYSETAKLALAMRLSAGAFIVECRSFPLSPLGCADDSKRAHSISNNSLHNTAIMLV